VKPFPALCSSAILTLAAISAPALSFQANSAEEQEAAAEASNDDNSAKKQRSALPALNIDQVLASSFRSQDQARDKFRNPKETLAFFQVKAEHTVVEYAPGGGWYTRVLAPYIAPKGKYIAMNADSSAREYADRQSEARSKGWSESFAGKVEGWTGISPDRIHAIELDEIPDEMAGTADRVLVFRSMHGLLNRNSAQASLKAYRKILKDGGMVGVVQHRAPKGEAYTRSNGSRGYIQQQTIIDLFSVHGFDLVASSEINANPKDKADYEKGVWHLFPTRIFDKENDAKYRPIGESDRMTLLFKKRP